MIFERLKQLMRAAVTVAALTAVCTAALYSCGSKPDSVDYVNEYGGCQIDDTIFRLGMLNSVSVYSAASDTVSGLCRDPLCTHNSSDTLCPQSNHIMFLNCIATDGKNIYMDMVTDSGVPEDGEPYKGGIYSYNLESLQMKKLCDVSRTVNYSGRTFYFDGYIYYKDCYYNDSYDPVSGDTEQDDQYVKFMRVKAGGGRPEQVLDGEFSIFDALYADSVNYYVYNYLSDSFTVYNRESGAAAELDAGKYSLSQVITYGGKTFFVAMEDSIEVVFDTSHTLIPLAVLEYDPDSGAFTPLATDITNCTISGDALWYSPFMTDIQFYGTRQSPTGRGNETAPLDLFRYNTGEIVRLDLETGEKQVWDAGQDEYGQLEPGIIGWSDGYLLATFYSGARYYATGESDDTVYKLTLNDDGTVTVVGSFGDVTTDG